MIPTGREAGDDVSAAAAKESTESFEPFEPFEPTEPTEPFEPTEPTEPFESIVPMTAPVDAPAGGAGEPATQGTDSALPEARDALLPRRVPQPSQLRGQAAITPAQPAEQTLRHLRDILDRLP